MVIVQIMRCHVSTIWECVQRETGRSYCVKVVDRRRFGTRDDEESTLREIAMLSSLQPYSSPHLVSLIQVLEDAKSFYIITQLAPHGNLLTKIHQQRQQQSHQWLWSEQDVRCLTKSILQGVQTLHDWKICHHDLQPENILLLANHQIQICDFGHAQYLDGDSYVCGCKGTKRYGNVSYASPEILQGKPHGTSSDMWSVGVMVYYCLCGQLPFEDDNRRVVRGKIVHADFDFLGNHWAFVSRPAKQFLASLLQIDPQVRLTAREALHHPWLASTTPPLLVPKKRSRGSLLHRIWKKLGPVKELESSTDPTLPSSLSTLDCHDESKRRIAVTYAY